MKRKYTTKNSSKLILSGAFMIVLVMIFPSHKREQVLQSKIAHNKIAKIHLFGDSHAFLGTWHPLIPRYLIQNNGIPGSQSKDLIRFLQNDRINISNAELIIVFTGANDILKGDAHEKSITRNFERFTQYTNDIHGNKRYIFIGIPTSLKNQNFNTNVEIYNEFIKRHCDSNELYTFIRSIDNETILDHGFPRKSYFKEDGIHLSTKSYTIVRNRLLKKINKLL